MKIEYLIEFLPPELRRQTIVRASRRRSTLLVALMLCLSIGVAAHSWNLYRKAEIDRSLSMQVCTNSAKVDPIVNKLAADQQTISRFLGVYDQIANPLETSDLIASLTHLMPEKMSLAMVKLSVEGALGSTDPSKDFAPGAPSTASAKPAKPAPVSNPKAAPAAAKAAKGGKGGKPGKDDKDEVAERPKRWMNAVIRGYAASNADLYDFERRLSRTTPLEEVTVTENKPTDVPGTKLQEFTITCRIPLDARYEDATAVASGPLEPTRTEGSSK